MHLFYFCLFSVIYILLRCLIPILKMTEVYIRVMQNNSSRIQRIIITLQNDSVGFGFRIVRATRESNECTAPTISQTVVEHTPTPLSLLKLERVVLLLEISCEPEGYDKLSEVENLVHSGCRAQQAPLFLAAV